MTMYLTEQLAQEIVNRTMAILPYNINVMDGEGRIIGSGDRQRISTKHEVASEVLRRKETVEIGKLDTEQWNGVKEGINLPIVFQGEILGVVGITGAPDETRGYGELVKMTTEMIIEQAFLQKQLQLDERIKEEFVHQLLNGSDLEDNLFYEKAKSLQIDLAVPRVVIIVKGGALELEHNRNLELMINELLEKEDLAVSTFTGEMVIVKKVYEKDGQWEKDRTVSTIRIWLQSLHKIDSTLKLAVGGYYSSFRQMYRSYEEAKDTLLVGQKLAPEQPFFMFDDFSIYVLMNKLASEIDNNPFSELVNKLRAEDELGELQRTLQVYIKENGKASNTANELFIHRNSLQYRLEKIKEITGKDPRNYKQLFELYLSLVIDMFATREK
ncbi:helix-turn-helix domain-containing protein [Alkalihalobacillus sp. MEB130]|uniref:sugar diacid recognition domain-containing protein n=1 Tax=Alkalihalobacillus sp. MEB130 TaxID=2976704 RepID=UPI0028DE8C39|nr:sugar diacid recognition domain-containing protein [Alkalihalobacillus sp. MEB130]MDT8858879.1 helix-turn-helix domain-containing protein [Alkalihalobacillus sp. MEB130]